MKESTANRIRSLTISGLPEDLLETLTQIAKKEKRSLSAQICVMLEERVEKAEQRELQPA
ncbi:MAG TPA: ribbon-helix-helix protein, CopG family [Chthoniobacteraceae bacterium]|jgi:hypothetical protein